MLRYIDPAYFKASSFGLNEKVAVAATDVQQLSVAASKRADQSVEIKIGCPLFEVGSAGKKIIRRVDIAKDVVRRLWVDEAMTAAGAAMDGDSTAYTSRRPQQVVARRARH